MCFLAKSVLYFSVLVHYSFQDCPEEVAEKGIRVTWPSSPSADNVTSNPLCYRYERLVTRHCNGTEWDPSFQNLEACLQIANYFDLSKCPPGHHPVSVEYNYCYQINSPSAWDYPCYKSGSASVITELNGNEIASLLNSLNATKIKRFWLPAQRTKVFNPVVWYIPGPNWGRLIESTISDDVLRVRTTMTKNCLLLDVEQRIVITEACSKSYPSFCLYINDLRYPSCPNGYHGFRFMPDDSTCFGIEKTDNGSGLTYDGFLQSKCPKPMGGNELMRFIFTRISKLNNLKDGMLCWFQISQTFDDNNIEFQDDNIDSVASEIMVQSFQGTINGSGTLGLSNTFSLLPCMACEMERSFKETEFILEYNEVENKIYLTVYYPSGLWRYDGNDKGVQCFSNAMGFVRVVDINDEPFLEVNLKKQLNKTYSDDAEKVVYEIDPVTYRAAQYWCEGHTKNFSLITTHKLIVSPNFNEEHVFAIVVGKFNFAYDENEPSLSNLVLNATEIFNANKVLVMDIFEFTIEHMLILMHLHVTLNKNYEDNASNIQDTFLNLKKKAESEFPKYNYTFVNISSSIFCLPTISYDTIMLSWDMTSIGHIAAPQQFCLQANGLPVQRRCSGSYLLGGSWGDIEGSCDKNYVASSTTKFLFDFVKGNIPENSTTRFLTDGLGFVLGDVNTIIPADIYYLSKSLQHVLYLAENNQSVDMGNIENVAWVMDRVMSLDQSYLRLSQTLNSTNVILDSINDIIEYVVEEQKVNESSTQRSYFLAVKPQFVIQISYPIYNNITGIAIIESPDSDNFTNMNIKPLFKNTTLADVLAIENLEVATWLPEQIIDSLIKSSNISKDTNKELHIVINVFYNDVVFQELDIKDHKINSRVVGISIPGYLSNLKYAVPLVFKDFKTVNFNKFCGYWTFEIDDPGNTPGSWEKTGCIYLNSLNGVTVCECYHLTNFGQLLNIGGYPGNKNPDIEIQHKRALNIITLVGSFLSLVGIIGIWITASVFSAWRQKAGTKILLHLSTAIAMPLIFIVVFNLNNTIFIEHEGVYKVAEHKALSCIILGVLLHYSILVSFMWMLITAALQFVRYVRVLGVRRPSRFMMKCTVIGWGVPLIPIAVILLLDKDNYIPESSSTDFGKGLICYPKGFILIMSVFLPICIILTVNIVLFIIVLYSIYRGHDEKMRSTDIDLIGAQFRLSIFLFFLLGLTWVFGIFSFTNNLLWSYLFCLTSTLQGFVLFVYFILCDPSTRNLWISLMKPNFRITSQRESVVSISSG